MPVLSEATQWLARRAVRTVGALGGLKRPSRLADHDCVNETSDPERE